MSDEDATPGRTTGAGAASIDGRLETIHRMLSTLETRIDALVTSTTTYRSALTDRLTEYANLVSKLSRDQAADLEEYRLTNERTLSELRRTLAGSDEVLQRVGERIDALLSDREASDDQSRAVLAEVRTILSAQENLSRELRDSLGRFSDRTIDEVRDALLDVASGEVVGALWDEFRAARESLDTLLARSEDTEAESGAAEETEVLRAEVGDLTAAVRELLEQAEVVDESSEEPAPAATTGVLDAVAADIAALRSELSEGLVVEPSEALSGTVDQLRAELTGLDDRMRAIADSIAESTTVPREEPRPDGRLVAVAADLNAMRTELVARLDALPAQLADAQLAAARPEPEISDLDLEGELRTLRTGVEGVDGELRTVRTGVEGVDGELRSLRTGVEGVDGELRSLRTGVEGVDGGLRTLRTSVEDIIARLDEGIVLAEGVETPTAAPPEFGDQFATLRDQISTEFDALRQLLEDVADRTERVSEPPPTTEAPVDLSPVTELLEHLRDDLAELPDRVGIRAAAATTDAAPATEPHYAALDPDTLDLLREEIRAAGGVSEEVMSALRNDLVALRRRIKLRAEGELFTDEQLDRIAEEVARRMGE